MKQIKIKQFGVLLLGLSMALMMSCSKDEEVNVVDNGEPVIPTKSQELTGEYEGQWRCMEDLTSGKIIVDESYIFIEELPTKTIVEWLAGAIDYYSRIQPGLKATITDSIGNLFTASSYDYPITDLQIRYELGYYSYGSYDTSVSGARNMLSSMTTKFVNNQETVIIGPPEPNTISFTIRADNVRYRIDLVGDQEFTAEFRMGEGLWLVCYWFKTFRMINLQTGHQYEWSDNEKFEYYGEREDFKRVMFNAQKRTGNLNGPIINYFM